jgi:acetyltransferase-like isoleucine patch superfamily enzyme
MEQVWYQLRYALPLWFVSVLSDWWPDNRITIRLRGMLCRPFFKRCGSRFTLARRVTFLNVHGIEIGDRVYIATGAWIDGIGGVILGDEVKISPYAVLASSAHCFKEGSVARGGSRAAPIEVGAGSWISSHVVVAAGATIGSGCLIAGNAAVSRDIPDGVMAGGVPARVLGPTPDREANVFARFERTDREEVPPGREYRPRDHAGGNR